MITPPLSPSTPVTGDPTKQADGGMRLSENPWIHHIPHLADRMGVLPGMRLAGPTMVIPMGDGREYDVFLMAHRLLDILEAAIGKAGSALGQGQQLLGNDRSLQEQVLAVGGRVGEIESKLGIEPKIGPVPPPRGQQQPGAPVAVPPVAPQPPLAETPSTQQPTQPSGPPQQAAGPGPSESSPFKAVP